jgi:putative DNA primase/helicase
LINKETTSEKPQPLSVDPDGIPEYLKIRPQWVVWKYELRKGEWTKAPYSATTFERASVTDLMTWTTFDDAWAAWNVEEQFDGIGFVFCSGAPFVGIDLDKCRNLETGEIEPWASEILERFEVVEHLEVSPSGTGVHLITRGKLRVGTNRAGIEIYGQERFFTITGRLI